MNAEPTNYAFVQLQKKLIQQKVNSTTNQTNSLHKYSRIEIIKLIEEIIKKSVSEFLEGKDPCLVFNSRTSNKNTELNKDTNLIELIDENTTTKITFKKNTKSFVLMIRALDLIHEILTENIHSTKRDLYYNDASLFSNQSQLDTIVDNIACMLKVSRQSLHVIPSSKGLVYGNLQFETNHDQHINCLSDEMGKQIVSSFTQEITDITSDAKFILLVEKEATFLRLLEDKFFMYGPCILITGKGQPDSLTRMFLKKITEFLVLPCFGLVDCDPYGIEILNTYKIGSKSMAYDVNNLATPGIKWLGIHPEDLIDPKYRIPQEALLPLTEADIMKGKNMIARKNMLPEWKKEVEMILDFGKKAEIQVVDSISKTFLSQSYLPNKINTGSWI